MFDLASRMVGYDFAEQIHESRRSLVWRARREKDGASVVIKMLNQEHPSAVAVAHFKREYELGLHVSGHGAVTVLGLESVGSNWAIVMKDTGARALFSLLSERRLDLQQALSLGASMAAALSKIHARRVVHKDVNPSNVLVSEDGHEALFIDFGLATTLPRENPSIMSPNVLEGTLSYISPEQTGRMNRSIDYRTDLYSLGVTLYQMLTGRLPFQSIDAAELVHLHIAQRPPPPHDIDPTIPPFISEIVMKLLAKTAEDRYRSASGLARDLAACKAELSAPSRDRAPFVPGQNDTSDRFYIPEKLYGREAEVLALLDTFDRAGRGRAELMLVAGYSGVGKTSLVHEIHKPVLKLRGYFIAGKFDQLQRDRPYGSLIQAFTDLVRQLLTEPPEQLQGWRHRLTEALGASGAVMVDVIPDLELIVGPQPELLPLSPSEAHTRFNFVFQRLVRAVATKEHPLVIFLDDVHRADLASLKLMEKLLTEPDLDHLLLIGAYRENEVDAVHPLRTTLEAMERAEARTSTLRVSPLGLSHVKQMVSDTLRAEPSSVSELAQLVFERTGGNPFFIGQLLRTLYDDQLIDFDAATGVFRWDMEAIRARGLTSDVVELMAKKIQKLLADTQEALQLAACIGNRFDLATLSIVHQRGVEATAADLRGAIEEGLLLTQGDISRLLAEGSASGVSCQFLHDRVQQAAYSLIPDSERRQIHLRIGRLLLKNTPPDELGEHIFNIVHQLNLGIDPDAEVKERYEVSRLNLLAGRKARASAAYEASLKFFEAGLSLLPEGAWSEHHDLCTSLHIETMEAAYVNGHTERGEALSDVLFGHDILPLERAKVHEVRSSVRMTRSDVVGSIDEGYRAAALLGVDLPRTMDFPGFLEVVRSTKECIGARHADDLLKLPAMTDPRWLMASRVVSTLISATFTENPLLALALVMELLKLCLEHGNAPEAPFFLVAYGLIHAAILGEVDTGVEYGLAAPELAEILRAHHVKARTCHVAAAFVLHWKMHLRDTLPRLVVAVHAGMEGGDHEYMGHAAAWICITHLVLGDPLDTVVQACDRYLELTDRWKLGFSAANVRVVRQAALNLMGRAENPEQLIGESFDESILPSIIEAKNYWLVSLVYILKTMLADLFRNVPAGVAHAEAYKPFAGAGVGLVSIVVQNFHSSLVLLAACRTATEDERARYLADVETNQATLKRWAEHAPMNSLHRYKLVEAELARVRGDVAAASILYEEAAEGAMTNRYLLDEALAHELAAEFNFSIRRTRLARVCIVDAANTYRRWGAEAKVADLVKRYPEAFPRAKAAGDTPESISSSASVETGSTSLDLATMLKAAQAISGEIRLDRVLDTLMRTVIENAGAQRGFLILPRDEKLYVEAQRSVDGEPLAALPQPVEEASLSAAIVHYVARTRETVVLDDAAVKGKFTADPHVAQRRPRSVLCVPLLKQRQLVAIVYVENNLTAGAFTEDRVEVLRHLSAQAALAIDNAVLYARLEEYNATLEQKVEARTEELHKKNEELERTLNQVREMQTQLVTQEKLASLGTLTAGIAHELKNPLNFVTNFAELSAELTGEVAATISTQRSRMEPEAAKALDDLVAEFAENMVKINDHGRRASRIIDSMLMHSGDTARTRQHENLNAILADSINLAYHGARGKDPDFELRIDAQHDPAADSVWINTVEITRVFVNLVANACYAMQEKKRALPLGFAPTLTVRTRDMGSSVEVRVRDNGTGIPAAILDSVCNPFFTTKPAGQGIGLGLSMSHDIIVGGHQGALTLESVESEFTEAIIKLPKNAGA